MNQISVGKATAILHPYEGNDLSAEAKGRLYVLTHLYVEPEYRNQGHASALLDHVHEDADKHGMAIMLNPAPGEGSDLTEKQLIKFYEGNDYVVLQKEPLLMVRWPYVAEKITILDKFGGSLHTFNS